MMTNCRRQLALIVSIYVVLFAHQKCHADVSEEIRAASVLFNHYEVVASAKADFLSASEPHEEMGADSETSLRLPFLSLIGSLRFLGANAEIDVEKNYGTFLVGAKDFVSPLGLGMVNSHNCYIGILKERVQPNLEQQFGHTTYESIDGRQVWTWSLPPYEGYPKATKFYAAQLAASYFVLSNNLSDFQAVTGALTSAEYAKIGSIKVPDWATFSGQSYWIFRSVQRTGVVDSNAAGISVLTPDVNSIIFFADVNQRIGSVLVLSSDLSMKSKPKVLPVSVPNQFQPLAAGVWQASFPLSRDEAGFDALSHVFYFFGFGLSV
jgi:hypothetical protein